jgi:hypothetical protein
MKAVPPVGKIGIYEQSQSADQDDNDDERRQMTLYPAFLFTCLLFFFIAFFQNINCLLPQLINR